MIILMNSKWHATPKTTAIHYILLFEYTGTLTLVLIGTLKSSSNLFYNNFLWGRLIFIPRLGIIELSNVLLRHWQPERIPEKTGNQENIWLNRWFFILLYFWIEFINQSLYNVIDTIYIIYLMYFISVFTYDICIIHFYGQSFEITFINPI